MTSDHPHAPEHTHAAAFESERMADLLEAEAVLARPLVDQVIAAASRWFPAGTHVGRIVDLGCGPGVGTVELASAFPAAAVLGVDGAAQMLRRAADRIARSAPGARIETRQVDLDGDLAPLGQAELVWASMSIHHLADQIATLRGIRALLAPGGLLCIVERAEPMVVRFDDELGRPGIWEHIGAAWHRWAEVTRAHLPGAAEGHTYPSMLASAGLRVIEEHPMAVVGDAPDEPVVRAFLLDHLERTVTQLNGFAPDRDLEALRVWLDEVRTDPASFLTGAHVRISRAVFLAQPDPAMT